jgi:glycosyltransferase involved in cell wall biosynthesis
MKKIGISIIISTYKRKKILEKIVNNLSRQFFPKNIYEIIIVDSFNSVNSNFRSNNLVSKYNIFENSNAQKRNFGLSKSIYKYVVFIDDDCIPEKNFLFKYYQALSRADYKSFLCGSVIYPASLSKQNKYISFRSKSHFVVKKSILNNEHMLDPSKVVTMNMGLKSNYNKRIFFNKKFKNYGFEDFEFCYRLIKRGYKFYKSNPIISHIEHRSFKDYLNKFYFLGNIGSHIFKSINFYAYQQTKYYYLENIFILKKILSFLFVRHFLGVINKLFILINISILFKSSFMIKLNITLSYLLGYADRMIGNNYYQKWYK